MKSYRLKKGRRMRQSPKRAGKKPRFAKYGKSKKAMRLLGRKKVRITPPALTVQHPAKTAIINPFARFPGGVRLPDDTSYQTFCLTQSGQVRLMPTHDEHGAHGVRGFRLRPSMQELRDYSRGGFETPYMSLTKSVSDQINYAFTSTGQYGGELYWSSLRNVTAPSNPNPNIYGNTPQATYCWANALALYDATSGATLSSAGLAAGHAVDHDTRIFNQAAGQGYVNWQPLVGPMGFANMQGALCRPVAWGIRIRHSGIRDASTQSANVNPSGIIYFGTHTPQYEGNQAGDTDVDQYPLYDGQIQSDGSYTGGPGYPISRAALENNVHRGLVGKITLQELARMPSGLIIGTGPRSEKERLFRDVDFYAGTDRSGWEGENPDGYGGARQSTAFISTGPTTTASGVLAIPEYVTNTLLGSQPWFLIYESNNVVFDVETIIHWEIVPRASAFILPDSLKVELPNAVAMDAIAATGAAAATNPSGAAAAAAKNDAASGSGGPGFFSPDGARAAGQLLTGVANVLNAIHNGAGQDAPAPQMHPDHGAGTGLLLM